MDSAEGLKKLIVRSGEKSQTRFAKRLGYKGISSIQPYLNGDQKDKPLPWSLVNRMLKNVRNTGYPPVTEEEILSLSGIGALTKTEAGRSIVGYNAAITTGCYIPVLSIGDAMNIEEKEGEARVLSPIKHVLSDRPLCGDEFSVELPDDSMGVRFPAGSLAIVRPMKDGSPPLAPGQSAFLRITHADGSEEGVVRIYNLKGYSEITGEKIEDYKALGDGFPSFKVGHGAAFPKVKLVGRVVQIKVTYDL
jgi:hypothetical protein